MKIFYNDNEGASRKQHIKDKMTKDRYESKWFCRKKHRKEGSKWGACKKQMHAWSAYVYRAKWDMTKYAIERYISYWGQSLVACGRPTNVRGIPVDVCTTKKRYVRTVWSEFLLYVFSEAKCTDNSMAFRFSFDAMKQKYTMPLINWYLKGEY